MAARRLSCVRRGGSDRSRASTHLGCLARAVHARLERPSDILDVLRQGAMPVSLTRRVQRSWKAEGYRRRRTSTYVRAHVTHARPPGNPLARPAGTTVRARAPRGQLCAHPHTLLSGVFAASLVLVAQVWYRRRRFSTEPLVGRTQGRADAPCRARCRGRACAAAPALAAQHTAGEWPAGAVRCAACGAQRVASDGSGGG